MQILCIPTKNFCPLHSHLIRIYLEQNTKSTLQGTRQEVLQSTLQGTSLNYSRTKFELTEEFCINFTILQHRVRYLGKYFNNSGIYPTLKQRFLNRLEKDVFRQNHKTHAFNFWHAFFLYISLHTRGYGHDSGNFEAANRSRHALLWEQKHVKSFS